MLNKVCTRAFHFILYTNIFIAGISFVMCYLPFLLFTLPYPPVIVPYLVAVSCGASYNIHWFYGAQTEPTFKRTAWLQKNSRYVFFFAILFIIIASVLFFLLRQRVYYIIPSILLTIIYSAPVIAHHYNIQLPTFPAKTTLLALVWVYTTNILPVFLAKIPFTVPLLLLSIQQFLFILPLCLLFDLRHVKHDAEKGIRSIATLLPINSALSIYYGCIALSTLLAFIIMGLFSNTGIILLLPLIILFFQNPNRVQDKGDVYYFFFLDGLMGLPALLGIVFKAITG